MGGFSGAAGDRLRACRVKARAAAAAFWKHRTKNLGGIALGAGYVEHWLDVHERLPAWLLHERGLLLMVTGGLVAVLGFYNTLAAWFGWE